jgi:hypothetical protein
MRTISIAIGAALSAIGPSILAAEAPSVALDHLVLGISDLDRGMRTIEERTGVKPVLSGVHPDRGTWNALLAIGESVYLEIIAPNPEAQALDPMFGGSKTLDTLTPVLWLVRTTDADATVAGLREAGYAVSDPRPGSRTMPDGRVLGWRTFALTAPPSAVAPYFIEWTKDCPQPATTSPGGCRLGQLELQDPAPEGLRELLDRLGLEVDVVQAPQPALRFSVECPAGTQRFPGCGDAVRKWKSCDSSMDCVRSLCARSRRPRTRRISAWEFAEEPTGSAWTSASGSPRGSACAPGDLRSTCRATTTRTTSSTRATSSSGGTACGPISSRWRGRPA